MKPATSTPEADNSPIHFSVRRVPADDPATVLSSLPEGSRFAWFSDEETIVAHGVAARLEATGPDRFRDIRVAAAALWERIRPADGTADHEAEQAAAVPRGPAEEPRLVGGFSFQPDPTGASPWEGFPGALFVLPERLWVWQGGACTLLEATPLSPPPAAPRTPAVAATRDMERGDWEAAAAELVTRIRAGEVKKVVLARSRRLPPVDPLLLLRAFPEEKGTFRFLFEAAPGSAFVGASPEHLVTLRGARVETVALAGTAPRGRDASQDLDYGRRLAENPKDNVEHALIVASLDEQLAKAGARDVRFGARRIRRLRHVQHLETLVLARVEPGTHVLHIVDALHPTAAVGGLPVETAYRLVRRLEETPRGWYAGGIGHFTAGGEGTFVTAIRSGLATRRALHVYAGAGIVAGSHPPSEWQETQWKLRMMEEAARAADPDGEG